MSGSVAQPAQAAISLRDVSFRYGQEGGFALSHISLDIPRGQCVVVTGRSGCGKTTLTRLMNGLAQHVYEGDITGEVLVGGRRVDEWDVSELGRTVGSVFQNPRSQFVNQDVASEVAFGCENLGMPRQDIHERVLESARSVGVASLLDRSVDELSGGQKQAVIVASAYAMQPDVFVLDEPTASLDTEAMMQLGRTVARLKSLGKTVVVSEHRLWWLADSADRVILLEDGRITADWTAADYAAVPLEKRRAHGMRAWRIAEMDPGEGAPAAAAAPTAEEPAAAAEGLTVAYRGNPPTLRDLDIAVPAGSIVGLVGRNGAGKTTLLRCLAGLTRESGGRVVLHGRPVPYKRRCGRIHLVMQDPGYQLFAESVQAELEHAEALGRASAGRPRLHPDSSPNPAPAPAARCADAEAEALGGASGGVGRMLDRFGLAHVADRHPLSLSGGERQRLAIAAGVLQNAEVIVLDEPTSGLDFDNMNRVAAELRGLAQEGEPIVLVTHDYEFLCAACTEIAELGEGRITARYPLGPHTRERIRRSFGLPPNLR